VILFRRAPRLPGGHLERLMVEHFHAERNHQGKGNVLLFSTGDGSAAGGPVPVP